MEKILLFLLLLLPHKGKEERGAFWKRAPSLKHSTGID